MAKRYHATKVFAKLVALNEAIDEGGHTAQGARKAKRKMNDTWSKRFSRNVQGFWKASEARA